MIVGGKAECRKLLRSYIDKIPDLLLAGEACNTAEAKQVLENNRIDILFLDAQLKGSSGLSFIRSFEQRPPTVLISCTKEHAAEAYELDLTDFLAKPFSYERFMKAVQKVLSNSISKNATTDAECVFIKSDAKIVKLGYSDILFIEAMADYMMIYTSSGKYIMHSTMKALEQKLPKGQFLRVHRSYIINLQSISQVKDQNVFINSRSIPIGATYKDRLISRIPVI
jgi:DNA-binding LytR/AlgR family response regulator